MQRSSKWEGGFQFAWDVAGLPWDENVGRGSFWWPGKWIQKIP